MSKLLNSQTPKLPNQLPKAEHNQKKEAEEVLSHLLPLTTHLLNYRIAKVDFHTLRPLPVENR